MPGRIRPWRFSKVACTRTLRVDSSTTESIAVIRPVSSINGGPSAVTLTVPPTRTRTNSC